MEKIIICPNCNDIVMISELNCCIFRHAVYIDTREQIDPHASKDICDSLFDTGKIFGCGKPFKITILENGEWDIQKCDYI